MSMERYFAMETVFFFTYRAYVDPNLQRYHRAMSGRAGNRDRGRFFPGNGKFLAICIYIYIYIVILCEPLREHAHATSGTRAVGWPPLH